ncbi:GNAT family N-acetyltransferase [Nigerium massiliense]|uniref:GNAT family N-acetyltransferase n=1 Tax=Nigerium massiliense TaxID=1522317 RepID=UPI00058ED471|nr:GNAT family N-acetyltransferase [Nigerium massiliense]
MTDITVVKLPEKNRYEALLDGNLAGYADYMETDELIIFTHTEVEPEYEGRGVGGALARFSLDEVKATGTKKVMPLGPFYNGYMAKHAEYQPLAFNAKPSNVTD